MTRQPYRPSNGTEGDWFMGKWCLNCARDADEDHPCEIQMRALCFNIGDPEYPTEWVMEGGKPRCTAFTEEPPEEVGRVDDPRQEPLL